MKSLRATRAPRGFQPTIATADLGHRLENAVFLSLRRRKKSISYAAEIHQWECDFVTDMEAIQVCAGLNPRNQEREVRGAIHAAALPGRRRALILTLNQRDRIVVDGTTVEVIPAWEWLADATAAASDSTVTRSSQH